MKVKQLIKTCVIVMAIFLACAATSYSLPEDWEVQHGSADIDIKDTTMTIKAVHQHGRSPINILSK